MTSTETLARIPCPQCWDGVAARGAGIFEQQSWECLLIPVCMGCGGIGLQVDAADFRARANRVANLRSRCSPRSRLADPPPQVQLGLLEAMERECDALERKYGDGDDCMARQIAKGEAFAALKTFLRDMARAALTEIVDRRRSTDAETSMIAAAEYKAHRGTLDTAERQFKDAAAAFPDSALGPSKWGEFLLLYRRDVRAALACFEEALRRGSDSTVCHYNVARCLGWLNRHDEQMSCLERAKSCPDYAEFMQQKLASRGITTVVIRQPQTATTDAEEAPPQIPSHRDGKGGFKC
jgi:tetratricopeptide (TPR) repeat protein